MMEIAARTGAETYLEYYDAFGLRERTGIDLPAKRWHLLQRRRF